MERGSQRHPRRHERARLALPVRVRLRTPSGGLLEEEALTQDVSSGGMAFRTLIPLRRGQVVHLSAKVPSTLRDIGRDLANGDVYAIVRDVLVDDDGCRVGVMFYGEQPPGGYDRDPAARFLLPGDIQAPTPQAGSASSVDREPGDKRRHPRHDLLLEVEISFVDEWGHVLDLERAVTENLSLGGARVAATHPFPRGSVLVLRQPKGRFESRAEVVGAALGPDGVRRLNLKFLDDRAAAELLTAAEGATPRA